MEALESAEAIDKIVISTDSDAIESVVNDFNSTKAIIHRRSPTNAQDHSSTESVMLEFLKDANLDGDDVFILVQATSPFTTTQHFEDALEMYHNSDIESLLSVCRNKRFFWNNSGQPINYDFQNRPRRQDFEGCLMENGAFYINRVRHILKHQNRLSGQIGTYEMPEYTGLEIDEPSDWIIGEALMRKYQVISTKYKEES